MKRILIRPLIPHVVVVLLLVGIVIVGARRESGSAPTLRELATPLCRLDHGSCRAAIDAGRWIELTVEPRPVPAGTPFSALVVLHGIDARQVDLEFEGTDMNMGLFRQVLVRSPTGFFEARITLPVCATGAMRWKTRLLVHSADETLMAPFDLTTGDLSHTGT